MFAGGALGAEAMASNAAGFIQSSMDTNKDKWMHSKNFTLLDIQIDRKQTQRHNKDRFS